MRPSRLVLAIAAALPALALAAPGAGSAYRTDLQSTHVEDATSKGVNQVNMITCLMTAMRPDALVNLGAYNALVDESKCNPDARSSSGNSGSSSAGASAASYMNATLNSTRTSNSDPMRVKIWVDEEQEGFSATIHLNIGATEAPSATNPYGVFRLDYCGKGDTGGCMMQGYLEGSATGIRYFETENEGGGGGGGGGGPQSKALVLTTSGANAGAGSLQMTQGGATSLFTFAYNADHFLRRDIDGTDQCFSRDAEQGSKSVWRYGLYDAQSGDRVTVNSGFPIEYTTGGRTYNGHMGYWGLWLPPEASSQIASGAQVQRVQYNPGQDPTKTDYTLVKAEGRLMKYTKQTRTLASADKIKFTAWVQDASSFDADAAMHPSHQYEMYWDNAAGVFKVSGVMACEGGSGCQTQDLPGEQSVAASFFAPQGGARGWSQSLGGEVFIPLAGAGDAVDSASVPVIYRVQDLVYPANMPGNLFCLRECPTAASLGSYFAPDSSASSPFVASSFNNWGPTTAAAVVSYTTDASTALLKDAASAAVTFTDSQALQSRPQYQSGVRTGRLFTALSDAQCDADASKYCDQKVNELDVYYQWETGPNQWNQFAAVKDGAGAIVAFDAPVQVNYSVPVGAGYGQYAGKTIVLQYGGFGELWGIPGECVSRLTNLRVSCDTPESRYVPAFVIPFDEVTGVVSRGGTPLLVKWLDREIRFGLKNVSECTSAGVSLSTDLSQLPTSAVLKDPSDPASDIYIGTRPVVADAPRVIHGDVKY